MSLAFIVLLKFSDYKVRKVCQRVVVKVKYFFGLKLFFKLKLQFVLIAISGEGKMPKRMLSSYAASCNLNQTHV